jgi:hypothetical protein
MENQTSEKETNMAVAQEAACLKCCWQTGLEKGGQITTNAGEDEAKQEYLYTVGRNAN